MEVKAECGEDGPGVNQQRQKEETKSRLPKEPAPSEAEGVRETSKAGQGGQAARHHGGLGDEGRTVG